MRRHLEWCPACSRELARLGDIPGMLDTVVPADVPPPAPPPRLEEELLDRVAREGRGRPSGRTQAAARSGRWACGRGSDAGPGARTHALGRRRGGVCARQPGRRARRARERRRGSGGRRDPRATPRPGPRSRPRRRLSALVHPKRRSLGERRQLSRARRDGRCRADRGSQARPVPPTGRDPCRQPRPAVLRGRLEY